MRVVFLSDVPRVGKKYDIKEISDGYAMNFLLPRKLAEPATPKTITELEKRKKGIEIEREVQESLLLKNLDEIKGKIITIKEKADEKGHLFAQVHKKEIITAMKTQNHADIGEEFIVLEKPIKEIGEFEIQISVNNKKSSFQLIVERN
ncbi:MAG: 50S ribosomal protein L9 [Candidatus Paceibacterota bacterium]|jgi:large subunit ribosomal protein L9